MRRPQPLGPTPRPFAPAPPFTYPGKLALTPLRGNSRGFRRPAGASLYQLGGGSRGRGASLDDAVKFTVFLTDLANFGAVNEKMAAVLKPPYAARAAVQVAALPKGAVVELDAILVLPDAA